MKKLISVTLFVTLMTTLFGQTTNDPNSYSNFSEYENNTPSLFFDFQLKERTGGDIFMTGGISNHRVKNVKPKTETQKIEKEVWGIRINGVDYINSYPYSKIVGYNKIEGKGYYSYFIGEPARAEKEQRELGIIGPNDKQIGVCCKTAYVILPTGKILHLNPTLLLELCKDNEDIVETIRKSNIKTEDVYKMFEILKDYNLTKK
ncbi:MAG: hypothetical protein FWF65_08840 [Bacteroidetes bacterium]|nr:hypothetical protein [Bacteroidota bacterium]